MVFGRLFGGELDQIIGNGLPTTHSPHEVITTTTANASSIVQPGTVVILKNNQTLEDIVAILNAGGTVVVRVRTSSFP